MTQKIKIQLSVIVLIASFSCSRVEYYPDKPIVNVKTYMLAHKGGGAFDEGNTMEACKYGLKTLDGIEVDIQKTSDNNLWLSHSSSVLPCGVFDQTCFASISSNTLIQIDSCLGNDINYTELETLFDYISVNHPDKFISLDVKAWSPCDISHINVTREMNKLAQKIIDLTLQYHLENNVMVESEAGDFLYYVKTHSDFIETYLVTLGDFELGVSRALDAGFSGISFQYKFKEPIVKEQVDLLHRKGLKIQLWTVNDTADLEEAKSLNPDFIQTDNL
jgi:glycerophosphoryl diester phosphodiesterase